jgi:hypothetical protein
VDPGTFDRLTRRRAGALTRRSVVGAAILAVLGLGEEVSARKSRRRGKATVEACIPTGRKCPAKRSPGKSKSRLGCEQCCQGFAANVNGRKGKQVLRCTCKPVGEPADVNEQWQCCSGVSDGRQCVSPPGPGILCLATEQPCTADGQCCTGLCNSGASTTGPSASFKDTCTNCKSGLAPCNPGAPQDQCCTPRACVSAPDGSGTICRSITGEQCIPDPDATPTNPLRGSCVSSTIDVCPVAERICCRRSGQSSTSCPPIGISGPGPECCTGQCSIGGNCCAPSGANPSATGGDPCFGAETNFSCCSLQCNGGVEGTCL